jgi:hypothetical protein
MTKRLTRWFTLPAACALLITVLLIAARAHAQSGGTSILRNGNFEGGTTAWSSSTAGFAVTSPGRSGSGSAATISNINSTDRAQVFQNGLPLQPATTYEFVFWGRSQNGHDVTVALLQSASPFTNYGLQQMFDLTADWQEFRGTFTTAGFSNPVSDGRLRFRLNSGATANINIDDISLALSGAPPVTSTSTATATTTLPTSTPTSTATATTRPTNTPTATATTTRAATNTPTATATRAATNTPTATATRAATNTPTATATRAATNTPTATATRGATNTPTVTATPGATSTPTATFTPGGDEKLIFDWNDIALQNMGGFIQFKPLSKFPQFDNGDWVSGNFENGTIYVRVLVRGMPTAEGQPGMKLGFCFWQQTPQWGEECQRRHSEVPGVAGTERRFTLELNTFSQINNAPIDWAYPRWKAGFVVRNSRGKPVSNKLTFNWSGEDPTKWYPMDIRYTMVLVAPGGSFSGWENYGWSTP